MYKILVYFCTNNHWVNYLQTWSSQYLWIMNTITTNKNIVYAFGEVTWITKNIKKVRLGRNIWAETIKLNTIEYDVESYEAKMNIVNCIVILLKLLINSISQKRMLKNQTWMLCEYIHFNGTKSFECDLRI